MTATRSLLKFFGERGGTASEHRGQLHWPGTPDGFPFRGDQVPQLRDDEAESLPLAMDFHSRSFRLWEPTDRADFNVIMDRILNGWYLQHRRFDNYVPEQQEYVVRLEWAQIYGESPAGKVPGIDSRSTDAHETLTFPIHPGALQAG